MNANQEIFEETIAAMAERPPEITDEQEKMLRMAIHSYWAGISSDAEAAGLMSPEDRMDAVLGGMWYNELRRDKALMRMSEDRYKWSKKFDEWIHKLALSILKTY